MIKQLSLLVLYTLAKVPEITSQRAGSLKYSFFGVNDTDFMNQGEKVRLLITRALSGPFEGELVCEPEGKHVIDLTEFMNEYNVAVFDIVAKRFGQESVKCFQTKRTQDVIEFTITVMEQEQSSMADNYLTAVLIIGLLILHFLHGLETKYRDGKFVYKHQITYLICFLIGQLVLLPPLVWGFMGLAGFEPDVIQNLLLISSFPVPWFNVPFSFAINGEVSFARVITLCVPILGIVIMPFNLWFYSWFLHFQNPDIMHSRISICLAILVFFEVFGLLIKHFCPNRSECCIKPLKIFCIIVILALKIIIYHRYRFIFRMARMSTFLHIMVIPASKLFIGIIISTLSCASIRDGRAIITNMLIQNSMLSLIICRHIFEDKTYLKKSVILIFHDFVTIFISFLMVALHHVLAWGSAWYRKTTERLVLEDEDPDEANAGHCPVTSESLMHTSQA